MCRTCAQPDERKEPCTLRNVVYESECRVCNPPGTRKEADKQGLEERRALASLYVGESARSVADRAAEHWRDAESGKDESHMLEHQVESHEGEGPPQFAFTVVKSCKTSLERQVREAIRIQMRGTVLNKKGVYNRCKLTRLVVDSEWDEKVWKDAWKPRVTEVDEECVGVVAKAKRRNEGRGGKKWQKLEDASRVAWGEEATADYKERTTFMYSPQEECPSSSKKQGTIITFSGLEWLCRQMLKEVADKSVELSSYLEGVELWEEWEEEVVNQTSSPRSMKEERRMWRALDVTRRRPRKWQEQLRKL